MTRRLLTIEEAASALVAPDPPRDLSVRTSGSLFEPVSGRCISFVLSDESVGRDNHTVATDGWVLDNYLKNPVVLLSHDDSQPPVGRTTQIGAVGKQLRATVEFPDADTYPLGDTIYKLLRSGYMNAASVGWLPLEWKAANDRKRPGGLDFTRQEMLEWSIVSVPALPTALVTARSAGIDLKPLFDWATRLLDMGDFAVLGKRELEALRRQAKPLVGARRKAAAAVPSADPKADPMKTVTEPPVAPKARDVSALIRLALARGLGHVAEMAAHMRSLEDLHQRMRDEADTEGDTSPNPDKMRAWLDDGHDMLRAMCGEETQEYKDGTQAPESSYYWSAASLESAVARALDERGLTRKGAKHSAETVRCMRAVKAHVRKAHDQLAELLGDDDSIGDEDDEDDDDGREERRAKAEALKKAVGSRQ